jgi:hypothetical protein
MNTNKQIISYDVIHTVLDGGAENVDSIPRANQHKENVKVFIYFN